jgi:hypothetical protein
MPDPVLHADIPPWRHELQRVLTSLSANLLLIGDARRILSEVQAVLAESVIEFSADLAVRLTGTCVVCEAEYLTQEQQSALVNRLDQEPPLRVVAISNVRLYPLVELNRFDEILYYRLNTIVLDCTTP